MENKICGQRNEPNKYRPMEMSKNANIHATSKSDDESSLSEYDWSIPLNWANVLLADARCSVALLRLYLKTSLLILSSCSFLSRSFSSRFCFRNLARRFLNQTCRNEKKNRERDHNYYIDALQKYILVDGFLPTCGTY